MTAETPGRPLCPLVERCRQLEQSVARLVQLKELADRWELFAGRRDQLREAVAQLKPHLQTLALFRTARIPVATALPLAMRARNAVVTIRAKYTRDPASIQNLGEYSRLFRVELPQLCEQLAEQLKEAWRRYTAAHQLAIDDHVLDVLAKDPNFEPKIDQVRMLRQEVERRRERLPRSESDLEGYHQAVAQLRAAWHSMPASNMPADVVAFLQAAVTDGAPLSTLTPDVQRWLAEQGLMERFYVVSR